MRHSKSSIGATLFYSGAIVLFVAWINHPHRARPMVVDAQPVDGNTLADAIAGRAAPQLIEFAKAQNDMRDMVIVITAADNSSRLMTLSRTNTPPPVLYRMGAELLTQGADHLAPIKPTAAQEEHAL